MTELEKIDYMKRLMDPASCTDDEVRGLMQRAMRRHQGSAMSAAIGLLAVLCQQGGFTEAEIADCIAAQRRFYYGHNSTLRPERTFKPAGLIVPGHMLD